MSSSPAPLFQTFRAHEALQRPVDVTARACRAEVSRETSARREVREEAGVDVHLEGILRFEHTPRPRGGARVRVIFVARPVDDTPPKSQPDEESLEARWVTLDELVALPQRGEEVAALFHEVAGSPLIMPMSMLDVEGAPRPRQKV